MSEYNKYINSFVNEAEYETYINSPIAKAPNTSLIADTSVYKIVTEEEYNEYKKEQEAAIMSDMEKKTMLIN